MFLENIRLRRAQYFITIKIFNYFLFYCRFIIEFAERYKLKIKYGDEYGELRKLSPDKYSYIHLLSYVHEMLGLKSEVIRFVCENEMKIDDLDSLLVFDIHKDTQVVKINMFKKFEPLCIEMPIEMQDENVIRYDENVFIVTLLGCLV